MSRSTNQTSSNRPAVDGKSTDGPTRRAFVQTAVAAAPAAAGTLLAAGEEASRARQPVRLGLIGVGIRGYQLHQSLRQTPLAKLVAISDVSDHYIERIGKQLEDPTIPVHRDYRKLLEDQSIDAVIIATPDHWHARMTLDALDAGKDVYVEKPMTYSLDEAIRVRDKARETRRVTQVGYQRRSTPHFYQGRDILRSGSLGDIHQIQLWSSRNRPTVPWRAYNTYSTPGLPAKSKAEHVDWDRFQANRAARSYDPRRFFHWQCYEEYSTGIFGILMSHPLDAANLVFQLGIPDTCSATGGIFHYKDGRTVPDTCNALFNYPDRKLTISFVGSSTNAYFDREAQYRGTEGTMELGPNWLRLYAERKNDLFRKFVTGDQAARFGDLKTEPIHKEPIERKSSTLMHLEDFLARVQDRDATHASIDECFKATVGMLMAIESYKSQRMVRWDRESERIVS